MTTWKHSSIKEGLKPKVGKKKKLMVDSFDNRNLSSFNEPFITEEQCGEASASLADKIVKEETDLELAGEKTFSDMKKSVKKKLKQSLNLLSGVDINDDISGNTTNSKYLQHETNMTNGVKDAFSGVVSMLSQFIRKIVAAISLLFSYFQSFMMDINDVINNILDKIANALTNGNASTYELNIFKNQTFRLLTVLLVWIFLYNWFFVIGFLLESPPNDPNYQFHQRFLFNIENTINPSNPGSNNVAWNSTDASDRSTIIYMLFGPAAKVIEYFNYMVVEIPSRTFNALKGTFSPFQYQTTTSFAYPVLFIIMAIFFIILVACDFQQSVISDFFLAIDSLNFGSVSDFTKNVMTSKSPSRIIIFIFVFFVVGFFAIQQYVVYNPIFKNLMNIITNSSVFLAFPATLLNFFIFCGYIAYNYFISVPLGFIFIFIYIFVYSFLAIVVYSLYYRINISIYISGINGLIYYNDSYTSSFLDIWKISTMYNPDSDILGKLLSVILTIFVFPFFLLVHFLRLGFKFCIRNLAEIVVGCMLLTGIGLYIKNYNNMNIIKPKSTSIGRVVFGQLFSWLIMINIILIILLYTSIRAKMKLFDMSNIADREAIEEEQNEFANEMEEQENEQMQGGGGDGGYSE